VSIVRVLLEAAMVDRNSTARGRRLLCKYSSGLAGIRRSPSEQNRKNSPSEKVDFA
jgi:hypothetical protein